MHVSARPFTGGSISELNPKAEEAAWPGYLGSPRHARADLGAAAVSSIAGTMADLALKIVDGFDHRQIPRYGDVTKADPGNVSIDQHALDHVHVNFRKLDTWLKNNGLIYIHMS